MKQKQFKKKQDQLIEFGKKILHYQECADTARLVRDSNLEKMYEELRDSYMKKYLGVQKWLVMNSIR